MSIRLFPNRTGQTARYKTGSPNYVDVSLGTALTDPVTLDFASRATSSSWVDGHQFGVLISLPEDAGYKVWTAIWDSSNEFILCDTEEDTSGTFENNTEVTVIATLTENSLLDAISTPESGRFIISSATAITLDSSYAGKTLLCRSGSATTITLPSTIDTGFQCQVIAEGDGLVSFARSGTDLINGGSASVSIPTKWGGAYVYRAESAKWGVIK